MSSNDPKKVVAKIGTRFVWEYYNRLNNDPDRLFEFFHENSYLLIGTEPTLTDSVTTLVEINRKIQVQNFKENTVSLSAVDCQEGINGGIFILVLGIISGQQESVPRKFVQTFFLAHEANDPLHFFVQNSVFRYLTESVTNAQNEQINLNHISASFQQPQPKQTQQNSIPSVTLESTKETSEEPIVSVEQPSQPPLSTPNEKQQNVQESQGQKGPTSQTSVNIPTSNPPRKWASADSGPSSILQSPSPETTAQDSTSSKNIPTRNIPHEEVSKKPDNEGPVLSIYIKFLSQTTTQQQIKDFFSKMGEITRITLRPEKGFCFVDYKSPESVKKVMEYAASNTIEINGKKVSVEEKKTKTTNFQENRGGSNRTFNRRDEDNYKKK